MWLRPWLRPREEENLLEGGWLRPAKNLSSLCELETVDMVLLSDAISEFDKRLERLDEVQGEVELLCDENEIDND